MTIGKYKISVIETATFGLDGGAMFGIIPKTLWQKLYPCDELNRISLGGRCLLLQSDSKKIIIEVGIGNEWDEKFEKIYDIKYQNPLSYSLEQMGIKTDDITDVILTHLHFDHVGGAVNFTEGRSVPAFPNAKYHIQKKHFDWALKPSQKDKGSFITNRFMPLIDEGMVNLFEGPTQFDDEIDLVVVNGHTIAQQLVKISDSSGTLFFAGDLFPTNAHIPIPYIMGYDIQPIVTIEDKLEYLHKSVDEEWKIIFGHDVNTLAATVIKTDKGFKVKERLNELL